MKYLGLYIVYLLIVWNLFRGWVRMPILLDELWFKPLIFLIPLWCLNQLSSKRERLWFFVGDTARSILVGSLIGLTYFVIYNGDLKIGIESIILAFAIAFTEEISLSGFVGHGLIKQFGVKGGIGLTGLVAVGLRLVMMVVWFGLSYITWVSLLLVFISTMINTFVFYKTKNIWSSILARFGAVISVL